MKEGETRRLPIKGFKAFATGKVVAEMKKQEMRSVATKRASGKILDSITSHLAS